MEDILKKPLFWIVALFTLFNVGIFIAGKVVIDKAADAVIEKLEKEYSPSPYGPGLDPDVVDLDAVKNQKIFMELTSRNESNNSMFVQPDIQQTVVSTDRWLEEWEADRGFPEIETDVD